MSCSQNTLPPVRLDPRVGTLFSYIRRLSGTIFGECNIFGFRK